MGNRRIIKSIEVSDFRGLHGSRILDFDGADIVLFLGLNGFGKTSVFDSIEWCLTGKLGRYERYAEGGRKQDFGKEKEVLRSKYAAEPNTFTKVILENGTVFGRRISSNSSEPDYNMGSIIDGCEYGVNTITKEVVKPELVNSYFSATHILSQETINHFVTSKKPEERYQALSVNFGTAIFSPFDGNVQKVLRGISDIGKEIKQNIDSKSELISTLNAQISSKKKDVLDNIREANKHIEILNKLSLNDFYKPLKLKNTFVQIESNFEEHVSSLKSRVSLDHSEAKNRLIGIRFLEDNVETWKEENAELKRVEESIKRDKEAIAELELTKKSIVSIKNEISLLQEKFKNVFVKRSRIQNEKNNLPHFREVSKKIHKLESVMKSRNEAVSVARNNYSDLENKLEDRKHELDYLKARIKELEVALSEIKSQKKLFDTYQSEKEGLSEKIKQTQGSIDALEIKINQYQSMIKLLETSSSPHSIKAFIDNPDYGRFSSAELITSLSQILDDIIITDREIEKSNKEEKQLSNEEEIIKNQFSEARKLLSSALTQVDQNKDESLCPVCDVLHETKYLVRHIETKLGADESDALNNVHAKLLEVREKKVNHKVLSEQLLIQLKNSVGELSSVLAVGLSDVISESSLIKKSIEEFNVKQNEIEYKYTKIISIVDEVLKSQPREYSSIVSMIEEEMAETKKILPELELKKIDAEELFSKNEKLIRDSVNLNEENLSELASIKDTKYLDVHQFLDSYGINSSSSQLEADITSLLSQVENDEKETNESIKESRNLLEQINSKLKNILAEESEEAFRKKFLSKESRLTQLKQSLRGFTGQLSKLEISPENYTKIFLQDANVITEKDIENMEMKFKALDRLITLGTVFKKFNSDNDSRKRVMQLEQSVEALNERKVSLEQIKEKVTQLKNQYPPILKKLIEENLDEGLFNQIYELLNPHRRFKKIDLNVDVNRNKIGINFNAKQDKISARPEFLFSSAQLNTFGICMFLSMSLRQNWLDLDTILIDDPIQNLDDINILSFIDFLRSLLDSKTSKKQIILSTHDERFYDLMIRKFQNYNMKSFKFESYGKLTPDILTESAV